VDIYSSAISAAIADPAARAGVLSQGTRLEVYGRSNLYRNLVEIAFANQPTLRFWIDSGEGAVTQVPGTDCNLLMFTNVTTVNNPTIRPSFIQYPLRPASPHSPADMELYQFAIRNPTLYSNAMAQRHPGTDFFKGPASSPLVGVPVVAVADGTILGYYDPALAVQNFAGQPWMQNASPTDPPERAYVIIQHGNTIVLYAHLQPGLRVGLNINDPVVANQWVGRVANNPAEGAHLHLEGRTNGTNPFQTANAPLTFVNAWQYFIPSIQQIIDQNIVNRYNDDQETAPGWNGDNPASSSLQRTQCFTTSVSPPQGAPVEATTGISVHGYDSSGNDYSAFEWIDSAGHPQVHVVPTGGTTWQSKCMP
jgi:murein DD-endopeptidase MepM/ murein hydrolase activator NlpD